MCSPRACLFPVARRRKLVSMLCCASSPPLLTAALQGRGGSGMYSGARQCTPFIQFVQCQAHGHTCSPLGCCASRAVCAGGRARTLGRSLGATRVGPCASRCRGLPTFGAGTARPATRSTSRQRARIATAMQAPTQQEQHALRAACAGRPPPRPSVPLPRPAAHLEARWPAAPPADASPHPPSGSGGTPAATLPAGVSERPFSRPAASSEPHGPGPNTTLGVPRQRHTRLTAQDKVTPHSQERLPPRESTNTAALSDHSSVPQRPTHGLPPAASTGAPNRG